MIIRAWKNESVCSQFHWKDEPITTRAKCPHIARPFLEQQRTHHFQITTTTNCAKINWQKPFCDNTKLFHEWPHGTSWRRSFWKPTTSPRPQRHCVTSNKINFRAKSRSCLENPQTLRRKSSKSTGPAIPTRRTRDGFSALRASCQRWAYDGVALREPGTRFQLEREDTDFRKQCWSKINRASTWDVLSTVSSKWSTGESPQYVGESNLQRRGFEATVKIPSHFHRSSASISPGRTSRFWTSPHAESDFRAFTDVSLNRTPLPKTFGSGWENARTRRNCRAVKTCGKHHCPDERPRCWRERQWNGCYPEVDLGTRRPHRAVRWFFCLEASI